jgi:hypothetical protein
VKKIAGAYELTPCKGCKEIGFLQAWNIYDTYGTACVKCGFTSVDDVSDDATAPADADLTETDLHILEITNALAHASVWLNATTASGIDDSWVTAIHDAIVLLKTHAADSELS